MAGFACSMEAARSHLASVPGLAVIKGDPGVPSIRCATTVQAETWAIRERYSDQMARSWLSIIFRINKQDPNDISDAHYGVLPQDD